MQEMFIYDYYYDKADGMAISLGTSPYFAITTSYCGSCVASFNPA